MTSNVGGESVSGGEQKESRTRSDEGRRFVLVLFVIKNDDWSAGVGKNHGAKHGVYVRKILERKNHAVLVSERE